MPSIIANLPEEVVSDLADTVDVATSIIGDVAGAAVTDVVSIFDAIEDGSIVSEIEGIPTDIINGITNGWNGFTDEIKTGYSDFKCLFKPSDDPDCASSSSAGFCSMPASAAASTTSDTAAAASASAAAAYTSDYYASASSAAAAYTSEYYASYYASVSSAAAASDTAATDTTTPSTTQQQVNSQALKTPLLIQSRVQSRQFNPLRRYNLLVREACLSSGRSPTVWYWQHLLCSDLHFVSSHPHG